MIFLQVSGLAKSVYYYTLSKIDKDHKNKEIIDKIKKINKRKYSSYKGTIGKNADNLIERNFRADNPNEKWYTDVTEFNLRGEKCYLSPILDGYNGEVISYNTSKSPNLEQINDMLNKVFNKQKKENNYWFYYWCSIIIYNYFLIMVF